MLGCVKPPSWNIRRGRGKVASDSDPETQSHFFWGKIEIDGRGCCVDKEDLMVSCWCSEADTRHARGLLRRIELLTRARC